MVLERVIFTVKEGSEADFVKGFDEGRQYLERSAGLQSLRLLKGVEKPSTFLLLIEWDTLEAHMEGFVKSEDFGKFGSHIAPHFAAEPDLVHYEPIVTE